VLTVPPVQHIEIHCNILQHFTTHCNTLDGNTLQHTDIPFPIRQYLSFTRAGSAPGGTFTSAGTKVSCTFTKELYISTKEPKTSIKEPPKGTFILVGVCTFQPLLFFDSFFRLLFDSVSFSPQFLSVFLHSIQTDMQTDIQPIAHRVALNLKIILKPFSTN